MLLANKKMCISQPQQPNMVNVLATWLSLFTVAH